MQEFIYTVSAEAVGKRVDQFLASQEEMTSRTAVKGLFEQGHITLLDGQASLSLSLKVREGWRFLVRVPLAAPDTMVGEPMDLDIVYEDAYLLVVNKPAGLSVHPGAGCSGGTLVNGLLHHCQGELSLVGGEVRAGLVHRLDKMTSGVLVVAKDDKTHVGLSQQFEVHSNHRLYECVVWGRSYPLETDIEINIIRHKVHRQKMTVIKGDKGKWAKTHYRTVVFNEVASYGECILHTGRTHQIRVHLSHVGIPLVGDQVYGGCPKPIRYALSESQRVALDFPRQALHARELGFVHPVTGEDMLFCCAAPPDFMDLRDALGLA